MDHLSTRIGTILGGVAAGLIPMAIFTPVYAVWAIVAWPIPGAVLFIAAVGWSAFLAIRAGSLLRFARPLPRQTNAYDARISRGMAIVSSIQGGLILTAIVVFLVLGRYIWILPVIVLIVALHFFPMPAIFGRTIDYYLGTVMLIVAGVGLYLASQPSIDWQFTWGVTGIGGALVTSAYGPYIVLEGRRVVRAYRALVPVSSDSATEAQHVYRLRGGDIANRAK